MYKKCAVQNKIKNNHPSLKHYLRTHANNKYEHFQHKNITEKKSCDGE